MICRQLSQASKSARLLSTSLIAAIAMWSGVPTSAFAAQDCAALANLKINNTAPEETYGQTRFLSGLALQTCRPGEIDISTIGSPPQSA